MLSDLLKRLMRYSSRFGSAMGIELATAIDAKQNFGETQVFKSASYSVLAADSGATFIASHATVAIDFTLPAPAAGLHFNFFNVGAAAMSVLALSSGDNIVTDGDAGADKIAFSTASHIIGAACSIVAIDTDGAGTYKWGSLILAQNAATIT